MTTWPLTITGEILVDGVWQSVSMREGVNITRGFNAEGQEAEPGECSVTLDNRDGTYSPRNPLSPLYGKIGRNTPFRLRVDDLPPDPTPELTDNFTRTVTAGWGTADTGQTWAAYYPATPPSATSLQVNGTTGIMSLPDLNPLAVEAVGLIMSDTDVTYTVYTTEQAQDARADYQIAQGGFTRLDSTNDTGYAFNIGFRTDTGLPGDQGLRVAIDIGILTAGSLDIPGVTVTVPGVTYQVNVPIHCRFQSVGSVHRARVWMDGDVEPDVWHAQLYDDTYTSGTPALLGQVTGADTTLPVVLGFDNLVITEPNTDTGVVRMYGEVPAWPPARNLTSSNITAPIKPAGILRRLEQGQKPFKSFMSRYLPTLFPPAYWPMEEGLQGNTYVADGTITQLTGPMRVTGLEFSQSGDVPGLEGSDPLPKVMSGATMKSPVIQSESTGYWSVDMAFRINEADWPTDATEHQILRFVTTSTGAQEWVLSIQLNGSTHRMRLRVYDENGTQVGTVAADHEGAGVELLDRWLHLFVNADQDGTTLNYQFRWQDPTTAGTWGNAGTLASTDAGRVRAIDTAFGSGAAGMFFGHVSVWGIRDTVFYNSPNMIRGFRGLITQQYLALLSGQANVPILIEGEGSERLGPVPAETFTEIVQDAATTEMGLLTELRSSLGLHYETRDTLYNRPVDLTLDWSNGEVFDPLTMTDDDKGIKNEVTAKRRDGSEYTATLETGALSIQPPPNGIGKYDAGVDTIVYDDDQLPSQASWRLHTSTVDEMRVTKLTLKMGNPRMQSKIDTVLLLDVGSRIQVTNVPSDLPPDGFDLLVLGYEETFETGVWDITFNCVPYSPWIVGEVSDGVTRADSDNSTLAASADSTTTSLSVAIASGAQRWIDSATYASDFPFDIKVGGERMTVTAITGTSSPQTFTVTRSVNGIVKTHTSGTKVSLFQPYYVAL